MYIIYNQNRYAHIPYPSAANKNATVKSGGCGVCAASMALENVLGEKKAPPDMASYSMKNGCRTRDGTDERTLLRCLCRDYPRLKMRETATFGEMILHLQEGGFAVTSTWGNRRGWTGLLSNKPHIFCVAGVRENGKCEVLDPGYYSGKYNTAGRRGKVELDGEVALLRQGDLKTEIGGRVIYLLRAEKETKEEEEEMLTYEEFKVMMDRYLREREAAPADGWAEAELAEAVKKGLSDGKRPQALVTRQEAIVLALRAMKGGE